MRLIDADALIDDAMDRYCKDCDKRKGIKNGKYRIIYEIGDAPCRACDVDYMVNDIESAPTVDAVDRKRGKWEWHSDDELYYSCSCCGHKAYGNTLEIIDGAYHFCPNCGADMRGEENERF